MSFQDSNGDGKGDLEGIMQRLSHLEWLGVDAVWLCPIYRSVMLDFGYDIIDHCDVDPLFGSLAGFDRLLQAMHGAVSRFSWTSCRIIPRPSICGSSKAARRAKTRDGIGTSGRMRGPTAARPASTIIMRSCASSPT